MVVALILWAVVLAVCFVYGHLALRVVSAVSSGGSDQMPAFPLIIMIGWILTGVLGSILSLVMRLNWEALAILLAGGAVYAMMDRKRLRDLVRVFVGEFNLLSYAGWAVLFFMLAVSLAETSLYIPKNYDTALYHAQAIRWIETYPAIPGLGNFHMRLAYNSSWLVSNALFSFSFLQIQSFHVWNGMLFALIGVWILLKVFSGKGRSVPEGIAMGMFILPTFYYILGNYLSSPGTDGPAVVLTGFVVLLAVDILFRDQEDDARILEIISVIIASYAVTVKLSSIPLIILPAFYFMRSLWKRDFRQGAVLLLAGLIPVLPWILRNVILSGYLVYPVAATGIPGLDWKMPLDTLERDVAGIRNWSYHIGNRKILEYIPFWLTGIRTQYKIIVYPAVIAFAVSAVYFVITRLFRIIHQQKQPMWNWRYVPLLAFSYIGVLYMFLTAPDVRYGSGIFIMFGVIHFAPIAVVLLKKYRPLLLRVYPVAVLSFMAVFSVYLFYRHYFREPDPDKPRMFDRENVSVVSMRMLMPADYENATKYSVSHVLGNGLLEYYTPKLIDRCWYDPFPSVPRPVPDVELRGNKVTSGFRHRQQSGQ